MAGRWDKWALALNGIAAAGTLAGIALSWWQLDRATVLVPHPRADDPLPLMPAPPRVAVVIPARDEAAHLAACLASLAAQRLTPTAIWVVNDHSTDATLPVLRQLAETLPTLHVVDAPQRPPDWAGKNWALHVGMTAALATGAPDWLLLTDADTWHHPDLLWRAAALVDEMGLDLLTAMPAVVHEGAGATLVRAAIGECLSFLYGADYPASTRDPRRPQAMAAGQFILVRAVAARGGLDRDGLRDALDDDRAFVMAVKAAGYRASFAYAQELLATEGYPTAAAAWRGHAHHMAASLGTRATPAQALRAVVGTVAALSLPFLALAQVGLTARGRGWRAAWPALAHWGSHALAVTLLRDRAAQQAHLPRWTALAAPPSALIVQALLLRLIWQHATGRLRVTWKGRRYR